MDIATLAGIGLAIVAILLSVVLEEGNVFALLNLPAAVIVFGGTIGATMASFQLKHTLNIPKWVIVAIQEKKTDADQIIASIVQLAETARREGILKLEAMVDDLENDFLRQGVTLIVDGTDYEVTKTILRTEVDLMEERHSTGAKFFTTAGGYAPTMGIIGTVMGLVNVLGKLSESNDLGGAIATAFIATLYGISSANIVYLPIAAKLKIRSSSEALVREIIIEGILSIQSGESPRIIDDRLRSFLPPQERKKEEAVA